LIQKISLITASLYYKRKQIVIFWKECLRRINSSLRDWTREYPGKSDIVVLCVPCTFAIQILPQRRKVRKENIHKNET